MMYFWVGTTAPPGHCPSLFAGVLLRVWVVPCRCHFPAVPLAKEIVPPLAMLQAGPSTGEDGAVEGPGRAPCLRTAASSLLRSKGQAQPLSCCCLRASRPWAAAPSPSPHPAWGGHGLPRIVPLSPGALSGHGVRALVSSTSALQFLAPAPSSSAALLPARPGRAAGNRGSASPSGITGSRRAAGSGELQSPGLGSKEPRG